MTNKTEHLFDDIKLAKMNVLSNYDLPPLHFNHNTYTLKEFLANLNRQQYQLPIIKYTTYSARNRSVGFGNCGLLYFHRWTWSIAT
ncbi:unnamed protein product [Adineta ricciae]|uniref:Uncharacterized protein n=1 Tax=Adineta ricciae TaxID=249248 RepID=A0A814LPD1_ADIRI|nr:unnamed protein product [Adineta ricciae]